jgi:transposase
VLACAEGRSNVAVAARLGVDRRTVRKWRTRFLRERLDGLTDDPRPGVPRTITDAQAEEVVVRTLELDPHPRPDHRPHLPLLLTHLQTGSLGGSYRMLTERELSERGGAGQPSIGV